ncbi:MAG: hypothetical protein Q9170_000940 [Blastenia crenularia]
MADDRQPSPPTNPEDDVGTESASSTSESDPVELLVTGREKRTTAGTRMSALLEREGDDELELLFAEDEQEEDDEFDEEDAEDGSDVQLDSDSSEDDQGPAKDDNDLEGEEELQQQNRVERQKKRKAHDNFLKPGALKKRMRVGAHSRSLTTPRTPAPRPKKKSERVSWLPASEEGPVRASSRKQTMKNKEIVLSRLVASEKRRTHQLQVMEEAAKRKEASKPKAMTQAQRMEEAARTERSNAKSLNRWETAEKKRAAEQKAKLEALHNRRLTGPVISWWSGMARWVNGKLKEVGWKSIKDVEAKRSHHANYRTDLPNIEISSENRERSTDDQENAMNHELAPPSEFTMRELAPYRSDGNAVVAPKTPGAPAQETTSFLDGIHYWASLPEQSSGPATSEPAFIRGPGEASSEPPEPVTPPAVASEYITVSIPSSMPPLEIPSIEYSGRNVVILEDLDANRQRLPELQNHVLLKKKMSKGPKKTKDRVKAGLKDLVRLLLVASSGGKT